MTLCKWCPKCVKEGIKPPNWIVVHRQLDCGKHGFAEET